MKHLTILSLLLAMLGFAACKKEQPLTDDMIPFKGPSEKISTLKEAWNFQDSLMLTSEPGSGHILGMRIKLTGPGKYVMTGNKVVYSVTQGGDIRLAEYILNDAAENTLNITGYDEQTKTITGNFSVTLKLTYCYDLLKPYYPKKIEIKNSTFSVQIIEKVFSW